MVGLSLAPKFWASHLFSEPLLPLFLYKVIVHKTEFYFYFVTSLSKTALASTVIFWTISYQWGGHAPLIYGSGNLACIYRLVASVLSASNPDINFWEAQSKSGWQTSAKHSAGSNLMMSLAVKSKSINKTEVSIETS